MDNPLLPECYSHLEVEVTTGVPAIQGFRPRLLWFLHCFCRSLADVIFEVTAIFVLATSRYGALSHVFSAFVIGQEQKQFLTDSQLRKNYLFYFKEIQYLKHST